MKTEEKQPDNSIMQEFMNVINRRADEYIQEPTMMTKEEAERFKKEALADYAKMYEHADLYPHQAIELATIYCHLFFAQRNYLRLNKEFSKYTGK